MTKVKSFINQFIAAVKGDDVEATAEKAYRQANSALKSQTSSLEGDTINLEEAVTSAKEKLASASINDGKLIADRNYYVSNLFQRKNELTKAEENLDTHLKKIEFLKVQQDVNDSLVDKTEVIVAS